MSPEQFSPLNYYNDSSIAIDAPLDRSRADAPPAKPSSPITLPSLCDLALVSKHVRRPALLPRAWLDSNGIIECPRDGSGPPCLSKAASNNLGVLATTVEAMALVQMQFTNASSTTVDFCPSSGSSSPSPPLDGHSSTPYRDMRHGAKRHSPDQTQALDASTPLPSFAILSSSIKGRKTLPPVATPMDKPDPPAETGANAVSLGPCVCPFKCLASQYPTDYLPLLSQSRRMSSLRRETFDEHGRSKVVLHAIKLWYDGDASCGIPALYLWCKRWINYTTKSTNSTSGKSTKMYVNKAKYSHYKGIMKVLETLGESNFWHQFRHKSYSQVRTECYRYSQGLGAPS